MIRARRIDGLRRSSFRRFAVLAGLALATIAVAYNDRAEKRPRTLLSASDCKAWDEEAAHGIAALLADSSAAAEMRLNEALSQLRRARLYCRSGSINVARYDYESLHRAFPITTGSILSSGDAPRGGANTISLPQ